MKWLVIKILEYRIRLNNKKIDQDPYCVVSSARKRLINSYETSIMYLRAEKKSEKKLKNS